jgi:ferrochelatase
MPKTSIAYILVNFGTPRNDKEVEAYHLSQLSDPGRVPGKFLLYFHALFPNMLFSRRNGQVKRDLQRVKYQSKQIEETEKILAQVQEKVDAPVLSFYRHMPETHAEFIQKLIALDVSLIRVIPLFPQFSCSLAGSCALWFNDMLPKHVTKKMRWNKSYGSHPSYIQCVNRHIGRHLKSYSLNHSDAIFLCLAHGVSTKLLDRNDIYLSECQDTFLKISEVYPKAIKKLTYYSHIGFQEWLKPNPLDACTSLSIWNSGRTHLIFMPFSLTSDPIDLLSDTLYDWMPIVKSHHLKCSLLPPLHTSPDWPDVLDELLNETNLCSNSMLLP